MAFTDAPKVYTVWFFFGGIGLTFSLLAFVSVIIIACPCALGIARPFGTHSQ